MRFALALLVMSFALVTAAAALTFPTLTGRVVDEANILDAGARSALTEKLAALETKTTDQLVVATVKSLQGTSVEDYANQLFRQWKLGQKDRNNGVLLLVAPNERKVRIEVGYGLEGTLTDALTRVIIENAITPRFRANDYAGGITRGADNIIQVLSGDAELFKQQTAVKPAPAKPPMTDFFGLLFVLVWLGLAALVVFAVARSHRRGGGSNVWFVPVSGRSDSWSSGSAGSSGGFDSGGGFSGGGGDSGGGGSSGSW
jgi:uncharacterized protein